MLGCITPAQAQALRARIRVTTGTVDLADREIVIEAVPEREDVKHDVLAAVSSVVGDRCTIASNTSSIPLARLAARVPLPERFLGLHFFSPVSVMPLVEIVPTLSTAPATVELATAFVRDRLGKNRLQAPDRAGFVVNALLVPYLLSAARMYEAGVATAAHIDAGMVQGCGHPVGPLALMDAIGLDTIVGVADSLHAEYREGAALCSAAGSAAWSRRARPEKSGRGFYEYSERASAAVTA